MGTPVCSQCFSATVDNKNVQEDPSARLAERGFLVFIMEIIKYSVFSLVNELCPQAHADQMAV